MIKKEIYVVTGVTASLGEALIEQFSKNPNAVCYGLFHSPRKFKDQKNIRWRQCELLDRSSIFSVMEEVASEAEEINAQKVILTHAVGPFAYEASKAGLVAHWKTVSDWEKAPRKGVDPYVWSRNVDIFNHVSQELVSALSNIKNQKSTEEPLEITLGTYGSVTEQYKIPLWFSFTLAKMQIFKSMKALVQENRNNINVNVGGFYLRTSTLNTNCERNLRPHASETTKNYWLTPTQVVEKTVNLISQVSSGKVLEGQLICPHPDFDPSYYKDLDKIQSKWSNETGLSLTQ